jgi:beta-glucosidase
VYLTPADPGQPVRLGGWAAAAVAAGDTTEVVVRCDERMWRRWDAVAAGWARLDGGELLVARGLGDVRLRLPLD